MYLVAGLGTTGQSVLRYFDAQGEPCLAFDTRDSLDISALQAEFHHIEFSLGEVPNGWLSRFETIVLSPGIAKSEPWVESLIKLGKQVIGDIELFARTVSVPVIAITGSNGKSTVTTMTGMALHEAGYSVGIGGNIGTPVLDLILDKNDYDVYVLELSSFQLETTYSLETVSATILNISEDHMDRYMDLEAYIQAKTKVFANTEHAVIPEGFSTEGLIHHAEISHFGLGEKVIQSEHDYGLIPVSKSGGKQLWLGRGKTPMVAVSEMKLQGTHHQLNALAMMALCQSFTVSTADFTRVVSSFSGLPHRTQSVGCYEGVEWVNDSKGTNVGATLTAIQSLGCQIEGSLILILGGVSKEADFSELEPSVKAFCRHTILFGRDKNRIAESLIESEMTLVDDIAEAVNVAKEQASSGDCVLFSPACASFDQFANYMQRGDIFMELVESLYASEEASITLPKHNKANS